MPNKNIGSFITCTDVDTDHNTYTPYGIKANMAQVTTIGKNIDPDTRKAIITVYLIQKKSPIQVNSIGTSTNARKTALLMYMRIFNIYTLNYHCELQHTGKSICLPISN